MPLSKTRDITFLCEHSLDTSDYALFRIAPFRKGQALTFGSALRRTLLQEIGSFACTHFSLYTPSQVLHDFAVLPGLQETLPQILQNIRGLRFYVDSNPQDQAYPPLAAVGSINVSGRRNVTAGDLCIDSSLHPCDPEYPIATLVSPYASFRCDVSLTYAKRYVGCIEQSMLSKSIRKEESLNNIPLQPILSVPIDPQFAPVQRVNYLIKQSDMYEYILLEVWTDKSITPSQALGEASVALKQLLQPFV